MAPIILLILTLQAAAPAVPIAPPATGVVVHIKGAVTQPLDLSLQDLRAMPRTTVKAEEHGNAATFEGVTLTEILRRAGAPLGSVLRGKAMASYVLVTARDGYRVVFALPEFDPDFSDASQQIILADTVDGGPLSDRAGPVRIVVPQEKKGARWIRMVDTIEVVKLQ